MRSIAYCSLLVLFCVCSLIAEEGTRARVFVTDSTSWEISGQGGGSSSGFGGTTKGGARPQTAEIIKTFGERCPNVVVNNKQDKADYVVLLDHEGGKSLALRDNKVAVFNNDGDSILSHSTRSLGNAVKDACEAISKDWPARSRKPAPSPTVQPVSANADMAPVATGSSVISVTSTPPNADIDIDGSFVGSTPSSVEIAQGEHVIVVKKKGYRSWERKMKVTSGSVNLAAELEKVQ
jgi:hypothetical protein